MTPITSSADTNTLSSLTTDVRHYLTQTPRQLPSRALYDTLGSALFDAICYLPWYPVTRAERRLIARHRTDILEAAGRPARLVELGPGNGDKLNLLLGRPEDRCADGVRQIDLVDVSPSALQTAERLVSESRDLVVVTHPMRYEDGLGHAAATRRPGETLCVLFLGSNIGNFDQSGATAFLDSIRGGLRPGDSLVIGADLVKPERDLLLAYDDPLGVTAAFNKNLLVHLNRELAATFDISRFSHRAIWNAAESRVEMHLVSIGPQRVDIPSAGVSFDLAADETIWTELVQCEIDHFESMLNRAGFSPTRHWIDGEGQFLLVASLAG